MTGTFPCLQFHQCNNVLKGDMIHHPYSGRQYPIKDFFTCDTSYVIKCPCGLLYVGETTQAIKDRILSTDKSTIRCKNLLLPIPYHFATAGHNVSQLRLQVIGWISNMRQALLTPF
ncbi:unnamed protein product [Ranitomeya imitator]|uniref:GIY-YIG homing endonuclease n=1 Tax=Ranitomeya imitator TaxID=111125 RepID=A0ABN9MJU5_9NEOB|nr:unnamed protein product [Ranitomeya imitator]